MGRGGCPARESFLRGLDSHGDFELAAKGETCGDVPGRWIEDIGLALRRGGLPVFDDMIDER
jgi:hypothetical protein